MPHESVLDEESVKLNAIHIADKSPVLSDRSSSEHSEEIVDQGDRYKEENSLEEDGGEVINTERKFLEDDSSIKSDHVTDSFHSNAANLRMMASRIPRSIQEKVQSIDNHNNNDDA